MGKLRHIAITCLHRVLWKVCRGCFQLPGLTDDIHRHSILPPDKDKNSSFRSLPSHSLAEALTRADHSGLRSLLLPLLAQPMRKDRCDSAVYRNWPHCPVTWHTFSPTAESHTWPQAPWPCFHQSARAICPCVWRCSLSFTFRGQGDSSRVTYLVHHMSRKQLKVP